MGIFVHRRGVGSRPSVPWSFFGARKGVWGGHFWAFLRCVNGGFVYTPSLDAFYRPRGPFLRFRRGFFGESPPQKHLFWSPERGLRGSFLGLVEVCKRGVRLHTFFGRFLGTLRTLLFQNTPFIRWKGGRFMRLAMQPNQRQGTQNFRPLSHHWTHMRMFAQPGIATSPPLLSLWSATTTHATLLTGSDRLAGFQLAVYQSRPQKFFSL